MFYAGVVLITETAPLCLQACRSLPGHRRLDRGADIRPWRHLPGSQLATLSSPLAMFSLASQSLGHVVTLELLFGYDDGKKSLLAIDSVH